MKTSTLLVLAALAAASSSCGSDAVQENEYVDLEPRCAVPSPDGNEWRITLRGRVYEPAREEKVRSAALEAFRVALGLDKEAAESAVFRERAGAFLCDHQGDRRVVVDVAGALLPCDETGGSGVFERTVDVPAEGVLAVPRGAEARARSIPVRFPGVGGDRSAGARILLVPPEGVTVVSDIDDTVKISEVLDRRRLLERTFLLPFEPVPGMAAAYRRWEDRGAAFHYLSAGPWQLQRPLQAFLDAGGFPSGSLQLRDVRWDGKSVLSLLGSPRAHKEEALGILLSDFPGRKFVLVGDSGEEDPEIYGAVARRFPDQVTNVWIREVAPGVAAQARYERAFDSVPPDRWRIFTDPATLE